MVMLINDPRIERSLIAERQRIGADHFDEVWEGVYVMAPNPNNEHQSIQLDLAVILKTVVGWPGLGKVFGGTNITDQEADWTTNYRIPDVAVFMKGNTAEDRGTHWLGGPDFAVEVISPNDRSREKLEFYARVGVRELLLIDRDPWQLEVYRLQEGMLARAAVATTSNGVILESGVVPLSFQLVSDVARPKLKIVGPNRQTWLV